MIKKPRGEDQGEAAFPVMHSIDGNWVRSPMSEYMGMSLRDYFAAKAMQGLIACGALTDTLEGRVKPLEPWEVACQAYQMANAMLTERD